MSKFNKKTNDLNETTNFAGGEAYKTSKEFEIISLMVTSFVKDKYYTCEDDEVQRLTKLVEEHPDKEFIGKCAIYVRNEFGNRSITHIVAGLIAKNVKGQKWTKRFYEKVFRRVDDITETLSFYLNTFGKPIPNSLKKGICLALNKFDGYQLGKYRAESKALKLVDIINLVHYKPTTLNKEIINDLMTGKLKSTTTWESMLSNAGNQEDKEKAKAEVWLKLLKEKKLGYFALLRNLKNIKEQSTDEALEEALWTLTDKKLIKNSLVLPFRYATAYRRLKEVENTQRILAEIDKAVTISLENVPDFDGTSIVVIDKSGSMRGNPIIHASLFASVLAKKLKCDVIEFGTDASYVNYNPNDSVMTIAEQLNEANYGGTNFEMPFRIMNKKYDRIIILSDMQGWEKTDFFSTKSVKQAYNKYCRDFNAKPYLYSWDLQGYGTIQLPEDKILCLAGWSEKIFDLMKYLEQDKNIMITKVKAITI